jgi:hypothetical protein
MIGRIALTGLAVLFAFTARAAGEAGTSPAAADATGSAPLPFASDSEKAEMKGATPAAGLTMPIILFTPWLDAANGSFTASIPQDWIVSGGRSTTSTADVAQALRVSVADDRIDVFVNDPDIIPRQVPDVMTTTLGQFREGQVIHDAIGNPALLQSYRSGAQFAQDYVWQKLCTTPLFTGGGEQRETADRLNVRDLQAQGQSLHLQLKATIGDTYFRCGSRLGYVSATTLSISPRQGPGAAAWMVFRVSGFMAEKSVDVRLALYVLHQMEASLHTEPLPTPHDADQPVVAPDPLQPARKALAEALAQLASKQTENERGSLVGPSSEVLPLAWRLPGARGGHSDVVVEEPDAGEDPLWGSRKVLLAYPNFWVDTLGSVMATQSAQPPELGSWKPVKLR